MINKSFFDRVWSSVDYALRPVSKRSKKQMDSMREYIPVALETLGESTSVFQWKTLHDAGVESVNYELRQPITRAMETAAKVHLESIPKHVSHALQFEIQHLLETSFPNEIETEALARAKAKWEENDPSTHEAVCEATAALKRIEDARADQRLASISCVLESRRTG